MWQNLAQEEATPKSGARLFLPAVSNSKRLLPKRPQLQKNQILHFDGGISRDFSQVSSDVCSTTGHLASRDREVRLWQAHIAESIQQVDQEIAAVEQVKALAESCLHERQLNSQLMRKCVGLSSTLSSAALRQDEVLTELRKEEQLVNDSKELLQNQIFILLDKISSHREIRTQLQADYLDKSEAVKLINKSAACPVDPPSSRLPSARHKLSHVSHEEWVSHSKNLKLAASNLVKDSSTFRHKLQVSLANLKISQERQHSSTKDSLRRKIHELNRVREKLTWEAEQVKVKISDLTKDMQRVADQIRDCESKMHQTAHSLDILNLRPRYELCLDRPHMRFVVKRQEFANTAAALHAVLKGSQQDLELAHKHLMFLEDKLAQTTHIIQVQQKCQSIHQSFVLTCNTPVIPANKPRFRPTSTSTQTYLQ